MPLWTALAALLLGLIAGVFGEFLVAAVGSAFGSSVANPTTAVSVAENVAQDLGFVGAAIYLTLLYRSTSLPELGFQRDCVIEWFGARTLGDGAMRRQRQFSDRGRRHWR